MKKLIAIFFSALALVSCKKEDLQVRPILFTPNILPTSSVTIELGKEVRGIYYPIDTIRADFNVNYSSQYLPTEDTLNIEREINDLAFNQDQHVLSVDAIPYTPDSISIVFMLRTLETQYVLKCQSYNVDTAKVYLYDNFYIDIPKIPIVYRRKVSFNNDAPVLHYFKCNIYHEANRFALVIKN